MKKLGYIEKIWRLSVCLGVAGTVFGTSCSSSQIQALVAGLEAAANTIDEEDDDISFTDWLVDELEDL